MRESALGFDSQATVGPELPLGAEAMRGLNQSDEQGCTDRPDSGNGLQAAPCGVLLAFAEPFPAYEPLQRIQLLVRLPRAQANAGFLNPGQPFLAMARRIYLPAVAWNFPSAVQRLDSILHSRQIFRDGQIASCQFPQRK
jgi:hypothetical protein